MRNWGTCHVEVYCHLLSKMLIYAGWKNNLIIHEAKWTGDISPTGEKYYFCLIGSPKLKNGYHGHMNFILNFSDNYEDEFDDFELKKDQDT
jgi:hypothetical protein